MSKHITNPGKKSLIAIVKSDAVYDQLQRYCKGASEFVAEIQRNEAPLDNAVALVNGGADIVVIETDIIDEQALETLEQLCQYVTRGGSFVVIADEPPISVVRKLFQAGVSDILPLPIVEQEFFLTLDKAAASRRPAVEPAPAGKGAIITILKSSGGVGATTLAVNLAADIKRRYGASVALADFDLQFGEMHIALDLKPKMSVIETIEAGPRLDRTMLRSTMTRHKSGVELLASPPHITPLNAITDDYLKNVFAIFRQSYDATIFELPGCWTDWTRTVLAESDLIVPVLEPTVRSGAGAARVMQCFHDLELTKPPLFVVANKVEKSFATGDRLERLKEIVDRKIDAVIRKDDATAHAASDCGLPLREISAKSPAAKDLERMAEKVFSRVGQDVHAVEPAAHKSAFSFGPLSRQRSKS